MMRGSRNSAFLFVLVACLLVSTLQSSTSYGQLPVLDVVVLRGATVIDGLGNPPLANATVVVEGDRIRSIFSGQDPAYPTDATVIDLSGKFMIPGFVDTTSTGKAGWAKSLSITGSPRFWPRPIFPRRNVLALKVA